MGSFLVRVVESIAVLASIWGMLRVLSVRWPSSMVNLRKLSGPRRWPKRVKGARLLVASEMQCREQLKELFL
jgi:hypothetical protein